MNELDRDLRAKTFRSLYLLYGTEEYLKKNYKKKLIEALLPEGADGSMNYSAYGENSDAKEIVAQAQTMPFFADRRVIVVENSAFFSAKGRKEDREVLEAYFEAPCESTVLIFVEQDVKKTFKAVKLIAEKGLVLELAPWQGETLKRWILSRVAKSGLKITNDAYNEFLARTAMKTDSGDMMEVMDNELEKLLSYCAGQEVIGLDDVESIVSGQVNAKVFSLVDAIVENDESEVMRLYSDLMITREPPEKILSLMEQQFMQLKKTASMVKNHLSDREMTEVLKQDWLVRKNRRLLNRISEREIDRILKQAEDVDFRVKSGKMDHGIALEVFLAAAVRRGQ